MPYITAAQRYSSPRPVTTAEKFANLYKTPGTDDFSLVAAQVNREPFSKIQLDPMQRNHHPLPSRPPTPVQHNYGFRRGGFGGEAGWNQLGYGDYGYPQTYGQQHGWPVPDTSWQNQGWQGSGSSYQNDFSQPSSFSYKREPAGYYHGIPPTAPAEQAWQQYYFRQYQQYAPTPQYLSHQNFARQSQRSSQYGLTQQWQTADSAVQLNANAPAFKPQAPLKSVPAAELNKRSRVDKEFRYGRSKPNAAYNNFTSANGGVPLPQPAFKQTAPWSTIQRTGPAANTRSSTRATELPEADGKNPRKYLLPRPIPSAEYMMQANEVPETISSPRSLLVILDLNGTLLYRKKRGGSTFKARPFVNEFLHYLLKNHSVMVWSSAQPTNVEAMCQKLFFKQEMDQLIAVWSRQHLRIPKHLYKEKVQVYKQLSWVWSNQAIQLQNPKTWSQANTVLIDDSVEKAASEPYNIVKIEEFDGKEEQMQVDVLGQVVRYLETLRLQKDVSAYMRSKPFVFDAEMSFDWTPFVGDTK